jgi:hypothetical protein
LNRTLSRKALDMGGSQDNNNVPTGEREPEGTGAEQGLQEDSGLRDDTAQRGEDTAAHLQDTGTPPQHG